MGRPHRVKRSRSGKGQGRIRNVRLRLPDARSFVVVARMINQFFAFACCRNMGGKKRMRDVDLTIDYLFALEWRG